MNSKGKEYFKKKQKATSVRRSIRWGLKVFLWFHLKEIVYLGRREISVVWEGVLKTQLQSVWEWRNRNSDDNTSFVGEKMVAGQEITIKGWVLCLVFLMGRFWIYLNAHCRKSTKRKKIKLYIENALKFISDLLWAEGPPFLYETGKLSKGR